MLRLLFLLLSAHLAIIQTCNLQSYGLTGGGEFPKPGDRRPCPVSLYQADFILIFFLEKQFGTIVVQIGKIENFNHKILNHFIF